MEHDLVTARYLSDNERYADLAVSRLLLRKLVENDEAFRNMDEDAYDMAVSYTKATELVEQKKYHER